MKKIIIMVAAILLCNIYVFGQLTGTKTIKTTGGDYSSIASAVADLNTNGVGSGGVTFDIDAGFTETLTKKIVLTATGTSSNPIVFHKSGTGNNPVITSYTGTVSTPSDTADGFWVFAGSDYVTIDGVDLLESSSNTTATTVMEFGFGLFKASVTDGCQYNTIKNCTITLNIIQNTAWTAPGHNGSTGIAVLNGLYNSPGALTITASTGSNSYNKFYANTIQNCNAGIVFVGYVDATSPYTNGDTGNDIGGTSSATGNSILNFGGGATTNPATGIFMGAQNSVNCSYNTINNNNGSGTNHGTTLRGIYWQSAFVASSGTCSNNTITVKSGATTSQLNGIEYAASSNSSQTVNINNNNVTTEYSTATTGATYAIYANTGTPGTLSISNNTINCTTAATSGSMYLIYNSCAVVSTLNLDYNRITGITFTATSTSATTRGIYCTGGANTCTTTISYNSFSNYNYSGSTGGSGETDCIYHNATPLYQTIRNDSFNNLSIKTTGTIYLIYNSYSAPANGTKTIQDNIIVTGLTRTAASGTFGCYYDGASSQPTVVYTFTGNNFSNISSSVTGTGTFYGLYCLDGATSPYPRKFIYNNTFSNISYATTGTTYGIYASYLGDASGSSGTEIYNNTVSNLSVGGTTYGMYLSTSISPTYAPKVYNNTIKSITTSGASSTIYGYYLGGGGAGLRFYKNTVDSVKSTGATGSAYGIAIVSATSTYVYNNFVANINAVTSSNTDAVRGISITSTSTSATIGLYYNTVFLNATSTSTTDFGSSGVYHTASTTATTSVLDMRNNIIVNKSTPLGTGYAVAFRRSSNALNNFSSSSNNNCLFAGAPGTYNLIFYDGSNSEVSLSGYQTRVSPREANSISEEPPFINTNYSPYNLHLSTSVATQCEKGAAVISTPVSVTDDFDGDTRNSSTPDVGADEGNFIAADLSAPNINYTALFSTSSTSARTLYAKITDASGVPNSGTGLPRLYWKKNNGSYNGVTATFVGNDTFSFSLGSGVTAGDTIRYYIVAQDNASTPNVGTYPSGGSSGFTTNPPAASVPPTTPSFYKILGTLASGSYKIGGSGTTPASGCTYVDITAAFKDLESKEIQGAVNFLLTNKYNSAEEDAFPIVLTTAIGSSSSNTITIKPDTNNSDTITATATAIFKFDGADNIIIDGSNNNSTSRNLLLENTSTTGTAAVIWFSSLGVNAGCVNNTVKNCIIRNGSKTVTTMYGVSIGSTIGAAGNDNDNNTILNNVIQKAYYGIYENASATGLTNNLTIKNNLMSDTGTMALGKYGMYILYARKANIEGNTIKNLVGTISNPTAIYLGSGVDSSTIIRNTINTLNYTGTSGYGGKGIDITVGNSNANLLIANNSISELLGDGWNSFTSDAIVGIRIHGTSGGIRIYNNSINLTGNISRSSATTDASAALYIGSTSPTIDIRNNILYNSLDNTTGIAKAYSIYSAMPNSAFTNINYNDYFVAGAEGVLAYLGADVTSLSAWQTATAQDANSLEINPVFSSASDLHYTVASLVNKGTPLSDVTIDIDGNSRSTSTPDIGCYEFVLKPLAITGTKTSVTSSGATINGDVNANNEGTANISFGYGLTTSYDSTKTGSPSTATGSSNTSSSATLTGLLPNSLYHYRVVGTNGGGSTYGIDSTFTTTAIVANVTTDSVNKIKADSATLYGSVKANNASTTTIFEYGKTTAYGSSVNALQSPVTGMTKTLVSAVISGLDPNTRYHFRAKGTNAAGQAYGNDDSFTTLAVAPLATTNAATSVSTNSAQLNGFVNARNSNTTVTFEWGTSTTYGNSVNADQSPATGLSQTAMSHIITGLLPNSTYHFRIVATNSAGTSYGKDTSFTTSVIAPLAMTMAASNVNADSADLNAMVNANNAATAVVFEFGFNTTYGMILPAVPDTVYGMTYTTVKAKIIGLLPNTVYHYRVAATNAKGVVYGNDTFFKTPVILPLASTEPASLISATAATLNGLVDPNNSTTDVIFEYGLTTSYGSIDTADQSPVTGMGNTAVTFDVTGLNPNTTYHFRVAATNGAGTVYGNDDSFTTKLVPPTAITEPATAISSDSATLNGKVNANNSTTNVYFEYGTTTAYGTVASSVPGIVTGMTLTPVSFILSGLVPNTAYHYRVFAVNTNGDTALGTDSSFVTSAKQADAIIGQATSITTNGATLNGEVNANNSSTAVSFEFGLTTAYGQTFTASPATVNGTTSTAVSYAVTGLKHSTTYHYRISAVNSAGGVYSADSFFTTADTLPILTTDAATAVTKSSAVSGGSISSDGGTPILSKGVCWSTSANPDVSMSKTNDGTGSAAFVSNITGLDPNTLYYVRAYAENALGVSYGNQISFTTSPNSIMDDNLAGKIKVFSVEKVAYIQIESKENINGHVIIFDLNGKKLTETRIAGSNTQIDLSAYSQSNYLVSVIINNKVYSTKIFVK